MNQYILEINHSPTYVLRVRNRRYHVGFSFIVLTMKDSNISKTGIAKTCIHPSTYLNIYINIYNN